MTNSESGHAFAESIATIKRCRPKRPNAISQSLPRLLNEAVESANTEDVP